MPNDSTLQLSLCEDSGQVVGKTIVELAGLKKEERWYKLELPVKASGEVEVKIMLLAPDVNKTGTLFISGKLRINHKN